MSCGVGGRRSSDLALLWLWRRLAATAPSLGTFICHGSSPRKGRKTGKEKERKKERKMVLKLLNNTSAPPILILEGDKEYNTPWPFLGPIIQKVS